MKKTTSISSFLLVAAGTSSAFGYNTFQGSDTLEVITKNMIALCNGIAAANPAPGGLFELEYLGGGSTTGESAMRGSLTGGVTQFIAPMSRSLRDTPSSAPDLCQDDVTPGKHQLAVARDALAVVTNASNIAGCDDMRRETAPALNVTDRNGVAGIDCPGCVGTTYTMQDWKDVLKVAYFGLTNNQNAGTTASIPNCNSDVRWELLSDFRNLNNTAAGCTNASCGEVKKLWRRDDVSGTTDTFKTLLGVNSAMPFCNSTANANGDEQDQDPIRRSCNSTDRVCGCDGKLGVVQAITIPAGTPASAIYALPTCTGARKLGPVADTVAGPGDKCLQGLTTSTGAAAQYNPVSGNCVLPTTAAGSFACRWQSLPIALSSCDNRVFNRQRRNAAGALLTNPDNGRQVLNGVFGILDACQEISATDQIGCLAANYGCSAGFAGFEATTVSANVAAFGLNGVPALKKNVHNFIDNQVGQPQYPFSRKLYLNSIVNTVGDTSVFEGGFADIASGVFGAGPYAAGVVIQTPATSINDQQDLYTCFKDPVLLQQAIQGAGLVRGFSVDNTGFFAPAYDYVADAEVFTAQEVTCASPD
jgi:ABC-type phosphate transport system substrate-binding protein